MKRWIIGLPVLLGAVLAAAPSAYATAGPYLDFGERPDFVENKIVVIGPEGVPQVNYAWGTEDNPVTVSHWALQHGSRWLRSGDEADLGPLITAADWLIGRERADGAWEYAFDFNAAGVPMRAPWISAMAQGMGISVLVRAHEATGEQRYLDGALLALEPFTGTVADGGVTSSWDGIPWYEEYPGEQSQHVLNGFEFALLGLHDLAARSALAEDLWDAGVESLAARIAVYDVPTARTQLYAAVGGGRALVGAGYKHEHAILTRTIADLTGVDVLKRYAAIWEQYEVPLPVPPTRPAAPAPPAVVRIQPPVATPPVVRYGCRLGDRVVRVRHASCKRARRVLGHFLRRGTAPRGWRCAWRTRAIMCRRPRRDISVRALRHERPAAASLLMMAAAGSPGAAGPARAEPGSRSHAAR